MQTLGLSESTPRTEGRLKSLFWPSIQSGADVDYLGAQGYWVCTAIALFAFVFSLALGQPITGVLVLIYYYLGGVGVRERSRFAAVAVLLMFVADLVFSPFSVLRILLTALLVSNLRATWIAALWKPESEEAALPPRLDSTWTDKFADRFPMWLWPKIRIIYFVFATCFLVLVDIGLAVMLAHRAR